MLLFFQFNNSILPKSLIQQPVIAFGMFCSFQYRLFQNSCCSFLIVYFYKSRGSIVVLGAQVSARRIECAARKPRNCWCSIDTCYHDSVMQLACTDLPEKAAITTYMNSCHKTTDRIPMMQYWAPLILHWDSFLGWGREHVTFHNATKGGQCLIYGGLQPIARYIAQCAKPNTVDTSLPWPFRIW